MRFAVHQPTFLPWPGLIHKAVQVDTLVLLDQVQYPRGFSWINSNRLKGMHGSVWFTIPVIKKGQGLQPIDQVHVMDDPRWQRKHLMTLEAGVTVQWLDYQRPVYPQLWGEFIKNLSAMDLLFNCGPYSRRILERAQK